MKKVNSIFMIILLAIMAGCRGENKQSSNDYITVDVTRSYPKKELILQDFMDVDIFYWKLLTIFLLWA